MINSIVTLDMNRYLGKKKIESAKYGGVLSLSPIVSTIKML